MAAVEVLFNINTGLISSESLELTPIIDEPVTIDGSTYNWLYNVSPTGGKEAALETGFKVPTYAWIGKDSTNLGSPISGQGTLRHTLEVLVFENGRTEIPYENYGFIFSRAETGNDPHSVSYLRLPKGLTKWPFIPVPKPGLYNLKVLDLSQLESIPESVTEGYETISSLSDYHPWSTSINDYKIIVKDELLDAYKEIWPDYADKFFPAREYFTELADSLDEE